MGHCVGVSVEQGRGWMYGPDDSGIPKREEFRMAELRNYPIIEILSVNAPDMQEHHPIKRQLAGGDSNSSSDEETYEMTQAKCTTVSGFNAMLREEYDKALKEMSETGRGRNRKLFVKGKYACPFCLDAKWERRGKLLQHFVKHHGPSAYARQGINVRAIAKSLYRHRLMQQHVAEIIPMNNTSKGNTGIKMEPTLMKDSIAKLWRDIHASPEWKRIKKQQQVGNCFIHVEARKNIFANC